MRRLLLFIVSVAALVFSGATAGAKSEDLSIMSFNIHGLEKDEAGDFSWEARKKGCLKAILIAIAVCCILPLIFFFSIWGKIIWELFSDL